MAAETGTCFPQEAPAAAESAATEAPAATDAPFAVVPLPTEMPTLEEAARAAETAAADTGSADDQEQTKIENEAPAPVSSTWQIALAGIALVGALFMLMMRQSAFRRWRQKE